MTSYKAEMHVQGSWSSNALRFAEAWEAEWHGSDLFSRWTMPDKYRVTECDDEITAHVVSIDEVDHTPGDIMRATRTLVHIPAPESRAVNRARAVCNAFAIAGAVMRDVRERCEEPAFLVPVERTVLVSSLPPHVSKVLKQATIRVSAGYSTVHVYDSGSQGSRSLVISVTGEGKAFRELGSWGGRNPFETTSIAANPVRKIPENGAVIHGTDGGYLTLHARPADLLAWLHPDHPANLVIGDLKLQTPIHHNRIREIAMSALAECEPSAGDLTPDETYVLAIYRSLNSAGRKRAIAEFETPVTPRVPTLIERLIERGYVKRSKSGAISVTPTGKCVANLPRLNHVRE